jgi:hypothetical protein
MEPSDNFSRQLGEPSLNTKSTYKEGGTVERIIMVVQDDLSPLAKMV